MTHCTTCKDGTTLISEHRLTNRETLPVVQPRLLEPPCADRAGALPEQCPGWCEYADQDPDAMFFMGDDHPGEFEVGMVLPQGIRLTERLGEGGMGTVFRGWNARLRQDVAVKFLAPRFIDNPVVRGRFLTEARALSRVSSPHIVPLRHYGQLQGIPYIIMDYVPGQNLADVIGTLLSWEDAFAVVGSVARGLAAVHDAGMVHNDIKPSNVIVGEGGHVTLVDFGLARPYASVCRMQSGEFCGTPAFMAPEIAGGWTDAPSPASDIYALGILAYEVFTARVPFDHPNSDLVLNMHMHHDAPSPSRVIPGLPRGFDELIAWALAKDPLRRIPSASVFARRLEELMPAFGVAA